MLAKNAGSVLLALASQVASHSLCPHGKAVSSLQSMASGGCGHLWHIDLARWGSQVPRLVPLPSPLMS